MGFDMTTNQQTTKTMTTDNMTSTRPRKRAAKSDMPRTLLLTNMVSETWLATALNAAFSSRELREVARAHGTPIKKGKWDTAAALAAKLSREGRAIELVFSRPIRR